MNRGNRRGRNSNTEPELPDLRRWLRHVRDNQGLSRPQVAAASGLSTGLLKRIELGTAPCTSESREELTTAYKLNSAQKRLTDALAEPSVALAPVEELRCGPNSRKHRATLNRLDERGMVGAYIDPLWNIVYANRCFRTRLPGVEAFDDNLSLWFFHPDSAAPTAEPLVAHWDTAALYFVASLRGGFGVHRDTPQALALFQRLRGAVTFNQMWENSLAVAYGHLTEPPVQLRDPATGEPYTASIYVGTQGTPDVRLSFAYRVPSKPAIRP